MIQKPIFNQGNVNALIGHLQPESLAYELVDAVSAATSEDNAAAILAAMLDQARRAQVRGEEIGRCRRCGVFWWQKKTRRCPACSDRHWKRAHVCVNGHLAVEPTCSGCGVPWSAGTRTPGCRPCYVRSLRRRRRAATA